ncbi:MAG TPA: hypothetical protein PLF61_06055, partial [Candidatus Goldiibacteriota bacterium]|nr:hypothetical protein [Candidatus Goldiibacteriota bacterium]
MKKKRFLMAAMAGILYIVFVSNIKADVNVGMTVTDEGLRNFYFSIGEFFKAPEKEVVVVRQQGIPDEEIAVVYFLAQRANVHPEQIIKWRVHNRWTWMKI